MTTPEAGRFDWMAESGRLLDEEGMGQTREQYEANLKLAIHGLRNALTAQAETIRRLEGEVARLTIAADECLAYELYTTVRQRAEAAERLNNRMGTALNTVHAWASNRPNLEGTAFLRGICEELLPATGEGA